MSLKKAKELREERARIYEESKQLLDTAESEGRALTEDEEARWDTMHADIESLGSRIERMEKDESVARALSGVPSSVYMQLDDPNDDPEGRDDPTNVIAFDRFVRRGVVPQGAQRGEGGFLFRLQPRESRMFRELPEEVRAAIQAERELRAQSLTDAEGGYMVPQGFSNALERALLQFGGLRQSRATILRTATGNQIDWPVVDDTSNEGALLSENTQDSEQDVTFDNKQLDAYKYTSKIVRVSRELLQDSFFDVDALLGSLLGERLGRIMNRHGTTGTGSNQPHGVVAASTKGVDLASSSAVTHDELIDLKHSVDPAYRMDAEWMMADGTLKVLKKLKDDQSRPLWIPGIAVREPNTIDGDPYVINHSMDTLEAAVKPLLYGDFSKFVIHDVLDISLVRLNERYADYHQVAFVAIMRFDSELIDAGTNPIKHALTPSP